MSGGQRKFHGIPIPARKERDEDLLLFRELHKKEKDRIVSLLQPVSEDFEANGTLALLKFLYSIHFWGNKREHLGTIKGITNDYGLPADKKI